MLGRFLERLVVAQDAWARPLGERLHVVSAAVYGRIGPVRDVLSGTWIGHPLHAATTDIPVGAMTLVIAFDVLGQPAAATVALVIGLVAMVASAATGSADYSTTDGTARARATTHATIMVLALVLYAASLALRAGGSADLALPIALSVVGYLVLAAGAFVGGDVVYVLGNMVDRHAWRPGGAKWQALDVTEIPEGTLVKAKAGAQTLLLVRTGDRIDAIHDQCAHAGAPLSGGTLVDGCVVCPWHASRFELATGRRRSGPTLYDQPRYEIRAAEGGGWEARRAK